VRIWDVAAGYLNRQSLLAEHRELHGLASILTHGKTGYSRHPETIRWVACLSGLARRHAALAAEMVVRGYTDRTPLEEGVRVPRWPASFVTPVHEQYALLRAKYVGKASGRIALPRNIQELWSHHKYSVMARDPAEARRIGRRVASARIRSNLSGLAEELVLLLRVTPPKGRLVNALEHMWGHVAPEATIAEQRIARADVRGLLTMTTTIAVRIGEPFLLASTALSELAVFV